MLADIIAEDPSLIGLSQPIIGVTDGSNATAGHVGEFVSGSASVTFAAYPQVTTTSTSVMVLQPGDWDMRGSMVFDTYVGGAVFFLNPVLAGASNRMVGYLGIYQTSGGQTEAAVTLIGQTARISVASPTLLAFTVVVNQQPDSQLVAGTATLMLEGRRMR